MSTQTYHITRAASMRQGSGRAKALMKAGAAMLRAPVKAALAVLWRRAFQSSQSAEAAQALPQSLQLWAIRAKRAELGGKIKQAVANGLVPDAHVHAYFATHGAELSELRRQLAEEDAALAACLRRIEARFPAPPEPLPEPEAPRPPRVFPRVGSLFGGGRQPGSVH